MEKIQSYLGDVALFGERFGCRVEECIGITNAPNDQW